MNAQHTPTPWKADILQPIVWSGPAGDDGLREIIARTDDTVFTHGTDVANAAFIVRACNSHDELVAALRKIALGEHWDGDGDGMILSHLMQVANAVLLETGVGIFDRAALAKAAEA